MNQIQLSSCPMVLTSSGLLSVPMAMRELYSFSRSCRAWMWNKHSSHVINPDRSGVIRLEKIEVAAFIYEVLIVLRLDESTGFFFFHSVCPYIYCINRLTVYTVNIKAVDI